MCRFSVHNSCSKPPSSIYTVYYTGLNIQLHTIIYYENVKEKTSRECIIFFGISHLWGGIGEMGDGGTNTDRWKD